MNRSTSSRLVVARDTSVAPACDESSIVALAPDASSKVVPTSDESSKAPWVRKASQDMLAQKHSLAIYVVNHLVNYGAVVYIGPGTTNDILASRIFRRQIEQGEPLDLSILTNNLTIFALGAELGTKHPALLRTTQIISTGGTFQHSINSVVGRFAAQAILSNALHPHLVIFGAAGVSFSESEGALTYHFEDELETQVALATCATERRLLVCDHSKLQVVQHWRGCTIGKLRTNTERCTIVTSCPSPADVEECARFRSAIDAFRKLLRRLRKTRGAGRLDLLVVNSAGNGAEAVTE